MSESEVLKLLPDYSTVGITKFYEKNELNKPGIAVIEELFPQERQDGSVVEWMKGGHGLATLLEFVDFNGERPIRRRGKLEELKASLADMGAKFYISPRERKQIWEAKKVGNTIRYNALMRHIFRDAANLLEAARERRAAFAYELLTTGKVSALNNGQGVLADYTEGTSWRANNLLEVAHAWDTDEGTVRADIQEIKQAALDNGYELKVVLLTSATLSKLCYSPWIKASLMDPEAILYPSEEQVRQYFNREHGLKLVTVDHSFKTEDGRVQAIPDNKLVFIPQTGEGLGYMRMGMTTDEIDKDILEGQVSVYQNGVALRIYPTPHNDVVQVVTSVLQEAMPSFEHMDGVFVVDAFPED